MKKLILRCSICGVTSAIKWHNCECCKDCYDYGNYIDENELDCNDKLSQKDISFCD